MEAAKRDVHDFWDRASCGEDLFLGGRETAHYDEQARARYALEPYIPEFARFDDSRGQRVLEIGVGLGADHERFARAGAELFGIDLTFRAVAHTAARLRARDLQSSLCEGDAENLPFPDQSFDRVYSWGVIHHSPDTPRAVSEIARVLKPGGIARIMVYHKHSLVGAMLWVRYALLALKPFTSMNAIYARHLESPGTKAYSTSEIRQLFARFSKLEMKIELSHGDLLSEHAGQRHGGIALSLARRVWPRKLVQRYMSRFGLFLCITATR
ncbi:MAG: class I SAM-dependent methyltransferase [Burkholderiales bacterium]|nr:class I SAM-dependent methyltransferase [Burkholderiales bacterium]